MIPVSPNIIGWWEWCFSVLLVDAGATIAEGLAVALTMRAVTMAVSVVGGLLFLQQRLAPANLVTPDR
jgi:glucose uptake protein GlcU